MRLVSFHCEKFNKIFKKEKGEITFMFKKNWKNLSIAAGLSLTLFAAGCGSDENATDSKKEGATSVGDGQEIELAYVEWDTEVAATHVIGKVLEDLGYDVKLTPLDNAIMWKAVSTGEADAMVSAWLPGTHVAQFAEYGDKLVDLGANLEGAKIGSSCTNLYGRC